MATLISWTNETWNPTTGCTKVSDGCTHCYAEGLSLRFGWSKKKWSKVNEKENVILHPERLSKPYSFKKPSKVFVNSMSDLFHEMIPDEFIAQVFAVMNSLPQHTFQILTKRPERAAKWPGPWTDNIWMGTSVEDSRVLHRVDSLRTCQAKTLFLSCEPLIGPLGESVNLSMIDWVIVGGESGPHLAGGPSKNPRWLKQEWAREIRDLCLAQGVAYFYKQDSDVKTERRVALVHEDGTRWLWQQYPGHLTPPVQVLDEAEVAAPFSNKTVKSFSDAALVVNRPQVAAPGKGKAQAPRPRKGKEADVTESREALLEQLRLM